ncbi:MAG: ribonuclease HI [Treponema sp.]|jgi:ribonuclease HI|nr:ribonuclease HI [Treponema sp.]
MYDIYTDGGCSGNPGPGGWAYVMVQQTSQDDVVAAEEWGAERNTTNNRMELLAVISALKTLKNKSEAKSTGEKETGTQDRQAVVHTDSQYVQKGITEWIHTWKKNSWRTSDKKPVKNQDLWLELDALAGGLSVQWEWIRGHAGNTYNEHCDKMVQRAIAEL